MSFESKIKFSDDTDWTDISSLVSDDYDYNFGFYNSEFKHVRNTFSLKIVFDSEIHIKLLNNTSNIEFYFSKDGKRLFTGIIKSDISTTIKNGLDYITIAAIDYTDLYDVELSANISTSEPKTIVGSINRLLSNFNLVTGLIPSLGAVERGTELTDNHVFKKGDKFSTALEIFLFEYGLQYYFDNLGVIQVVDWSYSTSGSTVINTIDSQIADGTFQIKKDKSIEDSARVKYYFEPRLSSAGDGLNGNVDSYLYKNGFGRAIASGEKFPLDTESQSWNMHFSPAVNADNNNSNDRTALAIYPTGFRVDAQLRNDTIPDQNPINPPNFPYGSMYLTLPLTVGQNTAMGTVTKYNIISESEIELQFTTPTYSGGWYLYILAVYFRGDILWSKSAKFKSEVLGTKKIFRDYESKYIHVELKANRLAKLIQKNISNNIDYTLESYTDYQIGTVSEIILTSKNFSTKGIITGKSYSYSTRRWKYTLKAISAVIPTGEILPKKVSAPLVEIDGINESGFLTKEIRANNLPLSSSVAVDEAGLYFAKDKIGFWNGSAWLNTLGSDGSVNFGDADSYFKLDALSNKIAIKTTNFELNLEGDVTVRGTLTAGSVIAGEINAATAVLTGLTLSGGSLTGLTTIQTGATITGTLTASGAATLSGVSINNGAISNGNLTIAADGSIGHTSGSYSLSASGVLSATGANISGVINASSGYLGTWILNSNEIKSDASNGRIELNKSKKRISVFDSSGIEKVAMGYLENLITPDYPAGLPSSAFGFWAGSANKIAFQSAVEFNSNMVIKNDQSLDIKNGATLLARYGVDSGNIGLHLWNVGGAKNIAITSDGNIDMNGILSTRTEVKIGKTGVDGKLSLGRTADGLMTGSISNISNEIRYSTSGGGGFHSWYTNSGTLTEKMNLSNAGDLTIAGSLNISNVFQDGNQWNYLLIDGAYKWAYGRTTSSTFGDGTETFAILRYNGTAFVSDFNINSSGNFGLGGDAKSTIKSYTYGDNHSSGYVGGDLGVYAGFNSSSTYWVANLILKSSIPSGTTGYTKIGAYNDIATRTFYGGIHFFDLTWNGGTSDTTLSTKSNGAVNLSSDYGVTFGPWNAPGLVWKKSDNSLSTASLTLSGLTASQGLLTDANKKLVSVALTGTGNIVRATSPTFTAEVGIGTAPVSGIALNVNGKTYIGGILEHATGLSQTKVNILSFSGNASSYHVSNLYAFLSNALPTLADSVACIGHYNRIGIAWATRSLASQVTLYDVFGSVALVINSTDNSYPQKIALTLLQV